MFTSAIDFNSIKKLPSQVNLDKNFLQYFIKQIILVAKLFNNFHAQRNSMTSVYYKFSSNQAQAVFLFPFHNLFSFGLLTVDELILTN